MHSPQMWAQQAQYAPANRRAVAAVAVAMDMASNVLNLSTHSKQHAYSNLKNKTNSLTTIVQSKETHKAAQQSKEICKVALCSSRSRTKCLNFSSHTTWHSKYHFKARYNTPALPIGRITGFMGTLLAQTTPVPCA